MLKHKHRPWLAAAGLALSIAIPATAGASATTQSSGYLPPVPQDKARITGSVNDNQKIALANTHSTYAIAAYDKGALPATQSFSDLTLVLKRSTEKQQEFDNLLNAQANPSSSYFHHWLTASQIALFAPNPSDLSKVTQWLQSRGLKVKDISPDGMIIHFSGNAAALNGAFNASMHSYEINGEKHFANANTAQIPAALAPIVQFVRLHNFFPKPQHVDVGVVSKDKANGHWKMLAKANATANSKPIPQFTVPGGTVDTQTTYDVAPADFSTIYNVNPLWSQGTRGAGQTIVVLERTDVNPADVQTFRKAFLPADAKGTVTYIHPNNCTDPGVTGDEGEAALDAEWAGAAAPDANIVLASCADNSSEFGAFWAGFGLAAGGTGQSPGNVWSLSYGECESAAGGDTTASLLWSDAEAEGVTVFVSTGDAGSAACDQNAIGAASGGAQVNIMASTPYDVAVGGTDFNDLNNYSQYWTSSNLALNESAISYVPEQTWNDSCASSRLDALMGYANGIDACNSNGEGANYLNTAGGGGGPSNVFAQPAWQAGVYGQTNFSSRTLPDVSLFAANGLYGHALVYCMSDPNENGTACDYTNSNDVYYNSAGGTSFAAPAMAGVQALINQASGDTSGNILPALYTIGTEEYGTNATPNKATVTSCDASNGASIGGTCVFNNVTVGNNDVPCWAGTANCYLGPDSNSLQSFGVVYATPSQSSLTLVPAWSAGPGYNMATGLGSVNVANLVNAVVQFEKPFHRANKYVAPYDFMSTNVTLTDWFSNDGFSDIAVVNPTTGSLTTLAMKGSVIRGEATQPSTPGSTIANAADYFPALDALGLDSAHLAWTGPGNELDVWISDDIGGFYPYAVASYAAGWKLLGSEVIDSSGAPQLLWYDASTSQYAWWELGTDPSTLAPYVASNSGAISAPDQGDVPTMADVNGDGYGDLVWTNPANSDVTVWINNQQGGYATHTLTTSRPNGYTLIGAGDFTGTGITDLVWINTSTHDLQIWTMNGFNITQKKTVSYSATYTLAAIADYNGDGIADLLWVDTKGAVYDWQGNGSYGFQKLQVASPDGTPFKVPAGSTIQPNWLQGSATGGIADPPALASH